MKFDIDALLGEYDTVGKQYAAAAAQLSITDEWKKITKAVRMQVAEKNGCTIVSKAEREALASAEYREAVEACAAAEENMWRLKMRLKSIELALDTWRTRESSARLERRNYPEVNIV